jgi:hypothetical protein
MTDTINDLTLTCEVKNPERSWYQVWKKRHIPKEITIHNADITIADEVIDKDGTIIYTLHASPKDIAKEFEKSLNDTPRNKTPSET